VERGAVEARGGEGGWRSWHAERGAVEARGGEGLEEARRGLLCQKCRVHLSEIGKAEPERVSLPPCLLHSSIVSYMYVCNTLNFGV
jgi:hypothetical protein